jgi:uncharacterized protein GlcG (DUF336 family)
MTCLDPGGNRRQLGREHQAWQAEVSPATMAAKAAATIAANRGTVLIQSIMPPAPHQQVIAMTIAPLPLSPTAGGIAWEPIR